MAAGGDATDRPQREAVHGRARAHGKKASRGDPTLAGQLNGALRQAGTERVYGVVGDSASLHRFVRRQFAIYSVRAAPWPASLPPSERTLTMGTARNARRAQDYTALGIAPQPVARREDGMRTTGEKDTYEWWYFDTHLDDGSSLVVVFYTKPFIEGVGKGLAPYVSVELDRPDGSHRQWEAKAGAAGFHE
jgi:hypothetical protein